MRSRRPLLFVTHVLLALGIAAGAAVRAHSGAPRDEAGAGRAADPAPAAPAAGPTPAPAGTPPGTLTVERLTDRVYCLTGAGGNVGVLVTDSGVVVIDDQYADTAPALVAQVRDLAPAPVRYVINTHYHGDHTGGNRAFAAGAAEIVAHRTVRPRLLEFPLTVRSTFPGRRQALEKEIAALADAADPYRAALEKDLGLVKFFIAAAEAFRPEEAAPPVITYDGRLTFWLGGQRVDLLHFAPGHTDGDSIVHFPDEKVLHMGDLFFNGMVPFIDVAGGGSGTGCIENLDKALALAPPDTRVIPGHGPVTDIPTLRRYRDFLVDLRRATSRAVSEGKSKADAVRAITALEAYPEIQPGFRTLGNDVAVFYDEIKKPR